MEFKPFTFDSFKNSPKAGLILLAGFLILGVIVVSLIMITKPSEVSNQHLPKQVVTQESELNIVHVSNESYRKLGIDTALLKREMVSETRNYGGEVMVPVGGKAIVTAPISGKLALPFQQELRPGAKVVAGQLLYRIKPILSADSRASMVNALADANSLVNTAKSQVDATEIALKRAKKLLSDIVGSQRNVDDAYANNEVSLRNLEAAKAKQSALEQVVNTGTIAPIDIKSPHSGIITNIFSVPDQLVSASNPIIEVSVLNTLWVRVPVPVGEVNEVDQQADAKVSRLGAETKTFLAKPINTSPTADPLTSAAHLYYAIQNPQSAFRPAERVSISLNTFNKQQKRMTIPWSAVVFDINGGSWVYTQKTNTAFERKRVFVERVSSGNAVINEGPAEGSKIVVNGALELFGVETGFSH
ncbi:MAG: efflux RND transporter periplasmic adaptor subunit [Methylotenera sp.]|uniref:efflux RND transporter periplasmic adaptor subunit n=1 Tax=Methylotenera sp. TaxID=2051956 RepID=UPI0024889ED9|nr:efflux RND transporter periplasmic adaptor subunit [Methylotenera sp.]MDI1310463.1 efflux RND transporter periplasmic adaptor subunit [Methylotenera sp.]